MSSTELARREERAQGGIIQFAEEMQAIRDENLYPGAKQAPDAWKSYCKERWAMGESTVNDAIRALPVLRRYLTAEISAVDMPSVSAAASVALLPESVQDAILSAAPKRSTASDKAKAARKVQKRIEQNEGREATDDELIAAASAVKPPTRKPKAKHTSRFTGLLAKATAFAEDAADYAQSNVLSDVENEYAWSRVEKLRYHADRIAEVLNRPEHVRDMDEEFAELMEGER